MSIPSPITIGLHMNPPSTAPSTTRNPAHESSSDSTALPRLRNTANGDRMAKTTYDAITTAVKIVAAHVGMNLDRTDP